MKYRNTLFLSTSFAAAIAGIGLAGPAFGIVATPNLIGTPDDGMICRTGYTGAFASGNFKCSKTRQISVNLVCSNATFATYVIRPAGSAGTPQGRDICTRSGVSVGSTDSVVALVQGQDYVLAAVDTAAVSTETASQDAAEAAALGLPASEVDTLAAEPVLDLNGGAGSKDKAKVTLTHYTFAVKTGGLASAQR